MNPNWRHDMSELLDERFSGVQSLQDLTKEAAFPETVTFTLDDMRELYKSINVIKDAIVSGAIETDAENEKSIVLRQLDDMDRVIKNKMKSEPAV